MKLLDLLRVLLLLIAGLSIPGRVDAVSADQLFFETAVRPILKVHCFQCHGEEPELAGGLDLRLARLIVSGGDSGAAVIPSDSANSLLLHRIDAAEMPPNGKTISAAERETLAQWIATGALTIRPEPEVIDDSTRWTPEELSHWSFQPLTEAPTPSLNSWNQAQNPIDAWLLSELQRRGQGFSDPAPRTILLRRLSLDLLGLPPEIDELERFRNDSRPDAYERQVDRMLAAPAYGERWGRHWLDIAGYADSDGYLPTDPVRPWAFRYRDWVINAFDADLSFDQFVIQQLAGDELDPIVPGTPSETRTQHLIATGFLRTVPDGTAGGVDDPLLAKHDVIAETIKVVTSSLLGLTVGCARCHDHRYDPISQRDYFSLISIFEPAFDVEQWRPPGNRLIDLWTDEDRERAAAVDVRVQEIEGNYNSQLDQLVAEIFEKKIAELDPSLHESARLAKQTPADQRNETQQMLLRDFPNLNVDRGSAILYEPARVNELDAKRKADTAAARAERPAEQFVACLTETPDRLPVARLLYRGEAKQPRDEMPPADLSLLGARRASIPVKHPDLQSSGRRLTWAQSLVDGKHPLVGRVWVNRIWSHHFGVGLVASLGDFGRLGNSPSHPQLLDHLAMELAATGWQVKSMQRKMVTSNAYRQSSARRSSLEDIDSDNQLLGRMPVRRLEAEAIRDSMLATTDDLNRRRFGVAIPVTQDEIGQIILGSGERDGNGILVGREESLGAERFRRTLYVQVRRSMPLAVVEPFDPATLDPNCLRRDVSTSPNQSLLLMNGTFTIERAKRLAENLRREFPDDSRQQIRQAWWRVCCNEPSENELAEGIAFLNEQEQRFNVATADDASGRDAKTLALESLCQAMFASNRFLYVE